MTASFLQQAATLDAATDCRSRARLPDRDQHATAHTALSAIGLKAWRRNNRKSTSMTAGGAVPAFSGCAPLRARRDHRHTSTTPPLRRHPRCCSCGSPLWAGLRRSLSGPAPGPLSRSGTRPSRIANEHEKVAWASMPKSTFDRQPRQRLLQLFNASIGDLRKDEVEE